MQDLLEVVNHHAAAVGMQIYLSMVEVMPAHIPDEQRQTVLLDDEPLKDFDKFK